MVGGDEQPPITRLGVKPVLNRGEAVLDAAPLFAPVVSDDSDFDLQDAPGRASRVLTVTLPKVNGHAAAAPWPSLLKD